MSKKTPSKKSNVKKEKRSATIQLKKRPPALTPEQRLRQAIARERPAWIPDHITADWDTDPYAYQTEEEAMSASFRHNDCLGDIHSDIKGIAKERGWTPYMDTFLLYRNIEKNKRERVAPDLLIVPYQDETLLTSSYDIETQPTPLCAIEIVSPSSKVKDQAIHTFYLEYLKIPTCVVIWIVDDDGKPIENPSIDVWHRHPEMGHAYRAIPDYEGRCYLPELQLWIGLDGHSVYFVDEVTGKRLTNVATERLMRQAAEEIAEQEAQRAKDERHEREIAQKRAKDERREREIAQKRAKDERREREVAQKRAEQEAQRAKQEAQRAEDERREREVAQKRAEQERLDREAAEAKIAQLQALLAQHGLSP